MLPQHLNTLHTGIIERNFPDFIATKFNFLRDEKSFPSPVRKYTEGYYDYKIFLSGNPLACNFCVKKNNPSIQLFEEDRKYAIKEDWMFLIQNLRNNKLFLIDKLTLLM